MAALKYLFAFVFLIGGAGALAFGVMEGGEVTPSQARTAPPISLREFPARPEQQVKEPEAAAVADAQPEEKKEEEAAPKAEEQAPKVEEKKEVKKAEAPPAPVKEGLLNLRASDTADVFLDGKKLGGAPVLGIKTKAGAHRVRFDCFDQGGNAIPGTQRTVNVKADDETDFEFTCPSE